MPPTPQPADDSHQQLLDQMDIAHLTKPFRNPSWKPSQRRNKNIKQILSEAQRREASVLATQNNSGASTPFPASGAASDGALTPAQGLSKPTNMAQATQSLSTLVLERNLQKAAGGSVNGNTSGSAGVGLGPAVTYTNIESAPSLHPAHHKHYCDITGLPSKYTDPKTKLRYHNTEIFGVVRTLPQGGPDQYLAARESYTDRLALAAPVLEQEVEGNSVYNLCAGMLDQQSQALLTHHESFDPRFRETLRLNSDPEKIENQLPHFESTAVKAMVKIGACLYRGV